MRPGVEAVDVVPGLDRTLTVVAHRPLAVRLDSITVAAAPGAIAIAGAELERRGGDLARALDGWEGDRASGAPGTGRPRRRCAAAVPTRCSCWSTAFR